MDTLARIEKQNEAILRRLDQLNESKKRWVKAGVITELTGWDNQKMRQARENGSVDWKKEEGLYWYDLNSLHPYLLTNKSNVDESVPAGMIESYMPKK